MRITRPITRTVPMVGLATVIAVLAGGDAAAEKKPSPGLAPKSYQKKQAMDYLKARQPANIRKAQACYTACNTRPTSYGCPPFGSVVPKAAIQACCKKACGL